LIGELTDFQETAHIDGFRKTLTDSGMNGVRKDKTMGENEKYRQKSQAGSEFFETDRYGRHTNINSTPAASRVHELRESIIKKGEKGSKIVEVL